MNEKIEISHNGYKIIFDFDAYKIVFPQEIPIDVWEDIQALRKYKLLYEMLTTKFSAVKELFDADYTKYQSLCAEYLNEFGK